MLFIVNRAKCLNNFYEYLILFLASFHENRPKDKKKNSHQLVKCIIDQRKKMN